MPDPDGLYGKNPLHVPFHSLPARSVLPSRPAADPAADARARGCGRLRGAGLPLRASEPVMAGEARSPQSASDRARDRARDLAPPLVVLAGSDSRPARLAESGRGYRPLTGFKSASLEIDGRPLVRCILDRLVESGRFSDLYVAGPSQVYSGLVDGARLVDCNDRLEGNLRTAFEAVREDHPHGPIAFLASDILPEVETIRAVMDRYADDAPCDVFFPLAQVPDDAAALGPSAWKPRYRIRPDAESRPRTILPGHLIIVDPDALRIRLVYRLIALSYRTRNRPMGGRGLTMLRGVLMTALHEDLRQLFTPGLPDLTAAVIADGAVVVMGLRSGNMTRERLERAVRRVVVSSGHRRRYPRRKVQVPILAGALSLARDIDTEEEAREIGADWQHSLRPAPGGRRAGRAPGKGGSRFPGRPA